ncbi:cholinesterase precursor [Fusarium subglutinans]|uniref:Carboxylic ester hydrolase n=1 Tax=Gibberella subglutinans TaxID=42677 RepID=A0A8H5US09_GIBSU|nr:cholinesterase precursor [Fusarium subglutinans]KAF5595190.1 cholinesterase precursor [Fusarium subglutinans]
MESLYRIILLAALLPLSVAVSTTVDVGYSRYKGHVLDNGVSEWLGIRYAATPTWHRRFKLPEDPVPTRAVQDATKRGRACIGTDSDPNTIGDTVAEDCLFLNVWAPTKASVEDSLPVYIYIQGGGFNGNSNANANGTALVVAGDLDMIVVSINYRVGVYGFLNDGEQITPNVGLHDQRKAFQWVQKHISKFGGNPDHVVIGGESAGAASVSLHLTAYGGKDEGLFHGAIAQSISFGSLLTEQESVYQFNTLGVRLGCLGTKKNILDCLQVQPPRDIQRANKNLPNLGSTTPPLFMWTPSIDGKLVPNVTYQVFEEGKFVKVPLMAGDDTNGGTVFTPVNTSSLVQSNEFMKANFPFITTEQLRQINKLYPNKNESCPNPGCWWRQVSDVYGDMRYMCSSLYISNALPFHSVPNSWNYWYDVQDPAQMAAGYGVPHVVENQAVFGPGPGSPASYLNGGKNVPVVPVIQAYWTSFIRTLDPNKHRDKSAARWDRWTEKGRRRLKFETGGKTMMVKTSPDLQRKCAYWADIGPSIRQ